MTTNINWDAVYEDIAHWQEDIGREPVPLVLVSMLHFLEYHSKPLPPGWQRTSDGYVFQRPEIVA